MDKLWPDSALVVSPKMAALIGLNEAHVLHQLHYWLEKNKEKKKNFLEGRFWTYNTYEDWQKQFPWMSLRTVKTVFASLKDKGLLFAKNFNKKGYDRTLWYSIDYDKVEKLAEDLICTPTMQPLHSHSAEFAPPIPETTSEITADLKPSSQSELIETNLTGVEKGGQEKMDTYDTLKKFREDKIKDKTPAKNVLGLWIKWKEALWNKTGDQQMHSPTGKELGQLKHLLNKLGGDTTCVVEFAVLNWEKFVFRAAIDNGLKVVPKKPHLGFLLENAQIASTMHSKVVDKKAEPATPIQSPAPVAIDKSKEMGETPITPEQQLAFLAEMGIEINV